MKTEPKSPILKSGSRHYINPDKVSRGSWINWYVYRPDYPLEAIQEEFQRHNSNPGGIYAQKPIIRVSSTRILVKQLIGYDV